MKPARTGEQVRHGHVDGLYLVMDKLTGGELLEKLEREVTSSSPFSSSRKFRDFVRVITANFSESLNSRELLRTKPNKLLEKLDSEVTLLESTAAKICRQMVSAVASLLLPRFSYGSTQ